MSDPRLKKLADVLVRYSTRVQQGDWVHIYADWQARPLVLEVLSSVLKAGGNPTYSLAANDLRVVQMREASDAQLEWVSPVEMKVIREADAWIIIEAPDNTRALSGLDPLRQQVRTRGRREWAETYMKRSASGELHWVITNYPCQALAQEAEMDLAGYEDFVYAATFVDQEDPVACWTKMRADQERLVTWLHGRQEIIIRGPQAELTLSISGRSFINSCGDQNMPSGEIFTSPVEGAVNGWVRFSYPAVYQGVEVAGARLEFVDGKVTGASAEKNEDFLLKMLETDAGASRLGELGIGTNYGIQRFTRNILYDEKIGGTFHLALGAGFEEAGGKNQSSMHWDMISDARSDTEMLADGQVFYKDGKFVV